MISVSSAFRSPRPTAYLSSRARIRPRAQRGAMTSLALGSALTGSLQGLPFVSRPSSTMEPRKSPVHWPWRSTGTPENRSGKRSGTTVPFLISRPVDLNLRSVKIGVAISRWTLSMTSSRRSSDSTSSQMPPPRVDRRLRKPAFTAESMPKAKTRI